MGQGAYTALPMLVAEELESTEQGRLEHAPRQRRALRRSAAGRPVDGRHRLRSGGVRAAATGRRHGARHAGAAAAQQWRVDPARCRAENGAVVTHANGRRLGYGELADAAAKLPAPQDVPLKEPERSSSSASRTGDSTRGQGRRQSDVRHRCPAAGHALRRRSRGPRCSAASSPRVDDAKARPSRA